MWLALFNLLFRLALGVLRHVERQQQMEEARVKAALELLRKADEILNDVDSIVAGVRHEPSDVLHDPANRDKPVGGSGKGDQKGGV